MATELKARSIKISDGTWERWQVMAAQAGVSVTGLIAQSVDDLPAAQARVAELAMALVKLEKLRGVSAGLPTATKTQEPVDLKVHHPAGAVLKRAAPSRVAGHTTGFNLKGYKDEA